MKWVHDVEPDNYSNTSADKARVMHMVHKRVDGPDRDELIRMLFAPMNPARARA